MRAPGAKFLLTTFATAIFSQSVLAGDTVVSGFLRAAGAVTTGDEPYLEHIDKNGSTGDSHFGLNVARDLSNELSVAGQLWASGAEGGGFEVMVDWAYASMRLIPHVTLNVGKIKYPNLLVSEYVDIGISYPWVRPPQELYSFDAEARPNMSLESFVGGSAIYSAAAGDLEYDLQVYGGEAGLESGGTLSKMLGAKFKVGTDNLSFIGAFNRHMPENAVGEGGSLAEKNGHDVSTISAGIMTDWHNVIFISEYAKGMVADVEELDTSAMYATLGYRIGNLLPHVTYADLDAEEGRSSVTLGLSYRMTDASTIKFELQQVTPAESEGEETESFNVVSVAFDVVF